ncbi:MAG: bifunctional glutamate N-acetyltransferase/amino-acid acetyltransferase ArgJ [Desulfobacterales bacterium]|nr:bifunctional glutamate N-acetyltransferase/amino-acid acetyltransferase ArgJ [Desulfobacterales bacterium]
MKLHEKAVMPGGFTCAATNCGLKKEGPDLAVFYSETAASAAGVFTLNKFPGAPVILGRDIIKKGVLRAIVANSKISNVGTGRTGLENAARMAAAVGAEFDIPADQVIMSSTGVIAQQLEIEKIEAGVRGISKLLCDDPLAGTAGIMTTDTYPKALSMDVDGAVLTIVGKGAGMIEPNMATMLVYIFTDADIAAPVLDHALRQAVAVSFNMLSVDTDTSTSDTCLVMANGLAGPVEPETFQKALTFACTEMTKLLARDAEGATKLLVATVKGAADDKQAVVIAKALVNSPLVKTMAYGADPNIGRVLMAIGKNVQCDLNPDRISIRINDTLVYKDLARVDFDENTVRKLLGGEQVRIEADLGMGPGRASAYGCDLTEGYIEENTAYYSS